MCVPPPVGLAQTLTRRPHTRAYMGGGKQMGGSRQSLPLVKDTHSCEGRPGVGLVAWDDLLRPVVSLFLRASSQANTGRSMPLYRPIYTSRRHAPDGVPLDGTQCSCELGTDVVLDNRLPDCLEK